MRIVSPGLRFCHADRGPVASAFAVVSGLEADKARLLAWTLVVGRIDVQDASARVGFRFGPRGHGDALLRRACHAVRIFESEFALITGGRLEIEDAARKAIGHGVGHAFAFPDTPVRRRCAATEAPGATPAFPPYETGLPLLRYGLRPPRWTIQSPGSAEWDVRRGNGPGVWSSLPSKRRPIVEAVQRCA